MTPAVVQPINMSHNQDTSPQDQWIDSVLDQAEGIVAARPSPDLLARIEQKIDGHVPEIIRWANWRTIAAAAAVLLALNFFALRSPQSDPESEGQTESPYTQGELGIDYSLYAP